MRLLLASIFLAACVCAQTPQTFEIRGTVTDPGLGGIAGVPIYVQFAGALPRAPLTIPPVPTTYTDGRGQFVIRTDKPGPHSITPQISGYSLGHATATVDQNRPRAEVSISLVRYAQITGRVVDPETREPIPNVAVAAMQRTGLPGNIASTLTNDQAASVAVFLSDPVQREAALRRSSGISGKDGIFTIRDLMPGDYAVSLKPALSSLEFSTEFSPEDLETTDQSAASLSSPVALASGSFFNVGDISLQKMSQYRALISIPQGACPQGESARLTLFRIGASESRSQVSPCGKDILLRSLEPGSYILYAVSDWQGERDNVEAAFWGTVSFDVTDKNTKALLSLERGIILDGKLVAESGVESLPAQIGLAMKPSELAPGVSPPVEQFIEWRENGRFRMAISPRPQTLQVVAIRNNLVVKQIRYNGSRLPNLTIPINTGTSVQNLEMILDNR